MSLNKKSIKKKAKPSVPKSNTIVGFYKNDGSLAFDGVYDYIQIELLGNHAKHNQTNNGDCDGYMMLVSAYDLDHIMMYQWYLNSNGYPATYGTVDKNGERWGAPYPLHRFLIPSCPEGYVVDHINRNRLDNRRQNLRVITAKQNSFNRKKPSNSKNTFKGVRKTGKTYKAVISKDGETYSIKDCKTERDAAMAYDAMAEELFGEYAGKNFPD